MNVLQDTYHTATQAQPSSSMSNLLVARWTNLLAVCSYVLCDYTQCITYATQCRLAFVRMGNVRTSCELRARLNVLRVWFLGASPALRKSDEFVGRFRSLIALWKKAEGVTMAVLAAYRMFVDVCRARWQQTRSRPHQATWLSTASSCYWLHRQHCRNERLVAAARLRYVFALTADSPTDCPDDALTSIYQVFADYNSRTVIVTDGQLADLCVFYYTLLQYHHEYAQLLEHAYDFRHVVQHNERVRVLYLEGLSAMLRDKVLSHDLQQKVLATLDTGETTREALEFLHQLFDPQCALT